MCASYRTTRPTCSLLANRGWWIHGQGRVSNPSSATLAFTHHRQAIPVNRFTLRLTTPSSFPLPLVSKIPLSPACVYVYLYIYGETSKRKMNFQSKKKKGEERKNCIAFFLNIWRRILVSSIEKKSAFEEEFSIEKKIAICNPSYSSEKFIIVIIISFCFSKEGKIRGVERWISIKKRWHRFGTRIYAAFSGRKSFGRGRNNSDDRAPRRSWLEDVEIVKRNRRRFYESRCTFHIILSGGQGRARRIIYREKGIGRALHLRTDEETSWPATHALGPRPRVFSPNRRINQIKIHTALSTCFVSLRLALTLSSYL